MAKNKELKETLAKLIWIRTGYYPRYDMDDTLNDTNRLLWLYYGDIEGDTDGAKSETKEST